MPVLRNLSKRIIHCQRKAGVRTTWANERIIIVGVLYKTLLRIELHCEGIFAATIGLMLKDDYVASAQ